MPPNLQTVSLKFARRRSAKVMGTLAMREAEPFEGEKVHGILVTHNFHSKIVQPEDLATYTPLRVGSVHSKLHVPYSGSVYTLRLFLSEMFAGISESEIPSENDADGDSPCVKFSLNEDRVSRAFSFLLCVTKLFCWVVLLFVQKVPEDLNLLIIFSPFCVIFSFFPLSPDQNLVGKDRRCRNCRMGS